MPDPGQTAYEARFTDEDRRKRYAHEWSRLGPIEREMWARVEATSVAAATSVIDGEDRIAAALRTINVGVLQIKADARTKVEAAEADLRTAADLIRRYRREALVIDMPPDLVDAADQFLARIDSRPSTSKSCVEAPDD